MNSAPRALLVLAITSLLAACDPAQTETPDVAGTPPIAVRVPFELYGVPGPWWRDNATQSDFDADMWACRTESKRARNRATSDTRKDVAYRTFLDCMSSHAWTRGHPPRDQAAG